MASQSSRLAVSTVSRPWAFPALLIKTSICFHSLGKLSIASKTAFLSLTSKLSSCVSVLNFAFNCSSRSCLLPHKISRSPLSAKSSAVAFPIPLLAPVIKIVFFFILVVYGTSCPHCVSNSKNQSSFDKLISTAAMAALSRSIRVVPTTG